MSVHFPDCLAFPCSPKPSNPRIRPFPLFSIVALFLAFLKHPGPETFFGRGQGLIAFPGLHPLLLLVCLSFGRSKHPRASQLSCPAQGVEALFPAPVPSWRGGVVSGRLRLRPRPAWVGVDGRLRSEKTRPGPSGRLSRYCARVITDAHVSNRETGLTKRDAAFRKLQTEFFDTLPEGRGT